MEFRIQIPEAMSVQDVRFLFADAFGEFINIRNPPRNYVDVRYREQSLLSRIDKAKQVQRRIDWAAEIRHQAHDFQGDVDEDRAVLQQQPNMISALLKQVGVEKPSPIYFRRGLASMQALVGGDIQLVPCELLEDHGITMYVNEEGKIHSMPSNFVIPKQDVIVGPALFVSDDEEGETCSLSTHQVEVVLAWLATMKHFR